MNSHFLLLLLFAALVSAVFATLARDEPSAQLRTGAWMFAGFLSVALLLGWVIYPLPL